MGNMNELSQDYEKCFELAAKEISSELKLAIDKFQSEGQQVDKVAYQNFIERKWILSRLKYLELNSVGVSNVEETEKSNRGKKSTNQRASTTA